MSEREQCIATIDSMTQQSRTAAAYILEYFAHGAEIRINISVASVGGIRFIEPLDVTLAIGEAYTMEYEPLNIYVVGESLEEARTEFENTVLFLYREYACESDEALTEDAKELKSALLSVVGESYGDA